VNGTEFQSIGGKFKTVFQLTTFQGVRFALFHYNTGGMPGGYADFNDFVVSEPRPRGLTKPIPISRWITFSDLANGNVLAVANGKVQSVADGGKAAVFRVVDRGRGRIALQTRSGQYVSAGRTGKPGDVIVKSGKPGDAETFQWIDLQRGETLLLSLATHRYIMAPSQSGTVSADHPGPSPDRRDGSCFVWRPARR
jgi:xylan 1,4-beta-xylosidase